jgi:hypothetical protein
VKPVPWIVSEYLDDGGFGIVSNDNKLIVRISAGFTHEELAEIVGTYNRLADKARARNTGKIEEPQP